MPAEKTTHIRKVVLSTLAIGLAFAAGFQTNRATNAQRIEAPRIPPVPESEWTDAQREILAPMIAENRVYNVYTTMVNNPDLMRDWLPFASHVLRSNTLPARDREILILRIGWLCQSEYEWAQHVRLGKATAGLTDRDIENIMAGPSAEGLSEGDRLLLLATDELHSDAFISDTTWAGLSERYDTNQMMDLVFTVGEYNLVSMALNSFGVQLDEGLEGFPE